MVNIRLIRMKMAEKRLTQETLAKLIGVSRPYVSNLCNQKAPHVALSTLLSIANILEVSVKDLISEESAQNPAA